MYLPNQVAHQRLSGSHYQVWGFTRFLWKALPVQADCFIAWNLIPMAMCLSRKNLMVILAATIPAVLIKKGTWLQARAYTLTAWFMFYFTFPEFYTRKMWVFPRNDILTYSLAALSLILNIMCVIRLIGFYKEKKHAGKPIINSA
ncbi:MAG: hypothetical protein ACI86X_001311 [Moritella sp.]|jgi:hypothetical protein